MRTMDAIIERAGKRVFSFDSLVAAWKADHEAAIVEDFGTIERQETESLLESAVTLWRDIEAFHESCIDDVMSGKVAPCLKTDKAIYELYCGCHKTGGKISSMLERLEFYNITFKATAHFRECLSEMKEVVNRIFEPSMPVGMIPADAATSLQSSFDASRHE